jgi:glycosyltransferase involved in cell wall biosynthesis
MRLLHIHMGYEGGAERFFVALANALARRGVEQVALIRPGRSWRGELPVDMQVEESDYRRWWLTRFTAQAKVRRLIREFRPDGMLAWMPRAAELLPAKAPCLRVTRIGDYPNPKAYWKFRHTDVLVCNTPDVAVWTRERGWQGRIEVVSNFTSLQPAAPVSRAEHATPAGAPLIVAVGRLVELKGYHVLIRALARIADAHLWIVGEGEERPGLEALARELGLSARVHLLGWRADPAPYLAAADVVCLPSIHETLGNAVLEGWTAGKPVVASRAPGPSWLIQDGVSGLLADKGNPESLASALARVIADPALGRALAGAALIALRERFSEEAICRDYMRLFVESDFRSAHPRSDPQA